MYRLFVTAPRGMADLLGDEVRDLGLAQVRVSGAGVSCRGRLEDIYRVCLRSTLASRVLLHLATVTADTAEALHDGATGIDWPSLFSSHHTFRVDASGVSETLRHTGYTARVLKDAVVDRFRADGHPRPNVARDEPDIRIRLHVAGGRARVSLDMAGEGLHRRGYRAEAGDAPLRENLAAAILVRAGWPALAAAGAPFLDPLCGSGTLVIEAARMAGARAPGLTRTRYGFEAWSGHDPERWQALRDEASSRPQTESGSVLMGADIDPEVVAVARRNAAQAGVAHLVRFEVRPLKAWRDASTPGGATPGLVATNPPYGVRLSSPGALIDLYKELGEVLRARFEGWRAAVLSGDPALLLGVGLPVEARHTVWNGPIEGRLAVMEVPRHAAPAAARPPSHFANRLRKNARRLGKWARREGVSCYRIYDRDMPEYNVGVDRYEDQIVVSEYAAPRTVEPARALERFELVLEEVSQVLEVPPGDIHVRQRRRQRGAEQYRRLNAEGVVRTVQEAGLRFEVNLSDYLDTGLFLDHRTLRARVAGLAKGKTFLNLYAYTGTATVYAAAAEAALTLSVDLSNTYLDWARRNLAANGFEGDRHRLLRADVRRFVEHEVARWDLVLLSPPTFSTSKGMEGTLDIQRDHVALIEATHGVLRPGGQILFSCPARRFKLDEEALASRQPHEITDETRPYDFARHPNTHRTWIFGGP
jgi:23S rRNA (guanine2445-N2)-methyltransferase / 23S rRNA (guanine2069-N7)-methyltransferase